MTAPGQTATDRRYGHGAAAPHSTRYLAPVIVDLCRRYSATTVLDIGCGNGALCRCLAEAGFRTTGIEPDADGVAHATSLMPGGRFYQMGVYDDPSRLAESDFDVVIATECVEHLYCPSSLLRFAAAKLAPSGHVIVTTPYHGYVKNVLISVTNTWDRHHDSLREGGHIKFWSRSSLTRLFEREGFEVVRFCGVGRIPLLWKSMVVVGRRSAGQP